MGGILGRLIAAVKNAPPSNDYVFRA